MAGGGGVGDPSGLDGGAGDGGGGPDPWSHRPSRNHRCIVLTDGSTPSPGRDRRRRSRITAAGRSPRANAASAAARNAGHEYDPGRSRSGGGPVSRARWTSSARARRVVMHPDARQTWRSDTARSRPARDVRNASDRCSSHSQTLTPQGRCSSARRPRPFPTQIAHAGTDPRFSPL